MRCCWTLVIAHSSLVDEERGLTELRCVGRTCDEKKGHRIGVELSATAESKGRMPSMVGEQIM